MRLKMGLIYKITNLINDKVYIGQTTRKPSFRVAEHKCKKSLIGEAINKFGADNFKISIIDHAHSKEELDNKEIFWIEFYDSTNPKKGYNISFGGTGTNGVHNGEKNYFFGKRGELAKNSIPVICIETNLYFASAKEAADFYNCDRSQIGKCCKGKKKTCGGYHWKYKNDLGG